MNDSARKVRFVEGLYCCRCSKCIKKDTISGKRKTEKKGAGNKKRGQAGRFDLSPGKDLLLVAKGYQR
jgi:hypothetical protein